MGQVGKRFGKWSAILAIAFSLCACSENVTDPAVKNPGNTDTTGGTGKPKKGLNGILVDQAGAPLKGVVVTAIIDSGDGALGKTAASPRAALSRADSVVTDSAGRYIFENLNAGTYNIQGDHGGGKLVVLIKRVKYDGSGALLEIKTDTLRVPGKITGSAEFSDGDNGGVLCYIPGTTFQALSDESGRFTLLNIPQGSYTLVYLKEGLKATKDTGIVVSSGETAKLATRELEADPVFPPPVPRGVTVSYDTLTGRATLRWRRVSVKDLVGYVVYRSITSGGEPTRLTTGFVKDTSYVDTLFEAATDTADKGYVYRLKSQDAFGSLSTAYSMAVAVKAVSPMRIRTTFAWKRSGSQGDSASVRDSVTAVVTFSNPSRKIRKLALYVDAKIVPVAFRQDSLFSGTDSIKVTSAVPAKKMIHVEATDDAGAAWWDSLAVRFVVDAPVANAGADTQAGIHTKVRFSGSASQVFGAIVLYKWDFDGDGAFDDSGSTGTAYHVYSRAGDFQAKLLVRDDDGNEGIDQRTVTVVNRAPAVTSIRPDTTVTILDPVAFHGAGTDSDGTVISHAWDFDGDGVFDTSSSAAIVATRNYPKPGIYSAIYRVTDDDGKSGLGTVKITVLQDIPTADAGKDTVVSIKDLVRLRGKATDKYGTIVSWAWDIGNTKSFTAASKGDTGVTAPATAAAAWLCILKVTDDDGNVDLDTVSISVGNDPPLAYAGKDTTVSIGDVIRLRGQGSDAYGTVAEFAWDAGIKGAFRVTTNGDTDVIAPSTPTAAYLCRLRVTDDDGQFGLDDMSVTVVQDAPVVDAGSDTTVAVGLPLTLTGKATQQYGSFAMYYWDWQANGIWDDSSAGSRATTFTVPTGGTRSVIFAAKDDDGNLSLDTLLLHAVSYVGGILSANANYIKSLSPFVLTGDLEVPAGVNLVISAGVKISGPYKILVKGGSLTAVGIAADSVIIGSQVKFEGCDLSASQIGFARMSGSAEALRVGDESAASQAAIKNSGTLTVSDVLFVKTKVTVDGYQTAAKLILRRMKLDSSSIIGTDPLSEPIEIFSSTMTNSTVTSDSYNKGITVDSSIVSNTAFILGCCGSSMVMKNSGITNSTYVEGGGSPIAGPLSFLSCQLTNTTVNLPYSAVNVLSTTVSFASIDPLFKIGHGTIQRSTFSGTGSGTGLEITGYNGATVGGVATVDTSTVRNFNIGVKVTNFGTLSMSGNNFVNNITYDLENLASKVFSALGCYWSGSQSQVNVDTRIRDASDDPTFGKVTSSPWSNILVAF